MSQIYSAYLESPGTKAYTVNEAKKLTRIFSKSEIKVQLSFGDLLEGDVGARHKGLMLNIAKMLHPRPIIKGLAKVLPIGLYLMISVRK